MQDRSRLRRTTLFVTSLALCSAFALSGALAEGETDESGSVAAGNGVVVHSVDTKELSARFRQVDSRTSEDEREKLAKELAELLAGDLDDLIEDSQGVYLAARDAAILRTAALDAETLKLFRNVVDDRARAALDEALRTHDLESLSQAARRNALSTHGPRLLVTLADRLLARGRLGDAVQALEDLLRLWPTNEPFPGVARAGVLSRLAALYAAHGDRAGVLHLMDRAPAAVLDGPSPADPATSLRVELRKAAEQARTTRFGPKRSVSGPRGSLALVGELSGYAEETFSPLLAGGAREIAEHPLAVHTPDGPLLITRITQDQPLKSRLVAVGPPLPSARPNAPGNAPSLSVRWTWPDAQRLATHRRGQSSAPFTPSLAGDLLLFPWPSDRALQHSRSGFQRSAGEPLHDLIALSLTYEGLDVDIRGSDEEIRAKRENLPSDRDPLLARLSFCGRPVVRGRAVFTTLVGYASVSGATQLHLACFDLVPGASGRTRLRLRWRTHVLDGSAIPPARFSSQNENDVLERLTYPTEITERYGQLFVGSNTGAMACLSASDGSVRWVETYTQSSRTSRLTVAPSTPRAWSDVPIHVDGRYLHVAPRDAEELLRYAAAPLLPSRSMLVDRVPVRGAGTARSAGSVLGSLLADDVVTVRDGLAYVSGQVPQRGMSSVLPEGGPLLAYRLRDRRANEPRGRLSPSQIPERGAAGRPIVTSDALFFPTYKGIYRLPFPRIEDRADVVWKTPTSVRIRRQSADRIGNLVADGRLLWSVTPTRIVLFQQR